ACASIRKMSIRSSSNARAGRPSSTISSATSRSADRAMDRLDCDRMFAAVMETGSFTAAAERRGTTSGQASKLVSRLEAELGVRLLSRTTRAASATEAGRAYYERLRPLLEEYEVLDQSVRNVAGTPRGRLRLTAPLTFGVRQLAPVLNEFAGRFEAIELD